MRHSHDEGVDLGLEPERLGPDFARLGELPARHHAIIGGRADADLLPTSFSNSAIPSAMLPSFQRRAVKLLQRQGAGAACRKCTFGERRTLSPESLVH